jgi:hypothetical protein
LLTAFGGIDMPTLDQGWAALLGAVVGGLFTLGGTLITGRVAAHSAAVKDRALTSATALLMQDDFLHFQATLARSLDRGCWWDAAELLGKQTSVDDRKTVWAASGVLATLTTCATVEDLLGGVPCPE